MLAQLTGRKAFSREIANEIVDRTDGAPLFIEKLHKSRKVHKTHISSTNRDTERD